MRDMPMAVMDSILMSIESREHQAYCAKRRLSEPAAGSGPGYVSEFHRELLTHAAVEPMMRRRPARGASSPCRWAWTEDDEVDLEYQPRPSVPLRPRRVPEPLEVVPGRTARRRIGGLHSGSAR